MLTKATVGSTAEQLVMQLPAFNDVLQLNKTGKASHRLSSGTETEY